MSSSKVFGPSKRQVSPFMRFVIKITRTLDPVPSEVSIHVLDKASSRFRIGLTTVIMLFGLIGSVSAIKKGKKARNAAIEEHSNSYQK